MAVKIKDENRVPDILKELRVLQGAEIRVGLFAPKGSETYVKAYVNEYGAKIEVTEEMRGYLWWKGMNIGKDTKYINIPERSYLRSTFDEEYKDVAKEFGRGFEDVVAGEKSAKKLLHDIGKMLEKAVKEKMKNIDSPSNHPFTVKKKGDDNPLIDDGGLRSKIEYRIK